MLSRLTNLAKRAALSSNKSTTMKIAKRSLISDLSTNMRITNDGYEINPDVDPMILRDMKREKELREMKANNPQDPTPNLRTNDEMPEDLWEDYIDPKLKQKNDNKSGVTLDFH